MFLDLLLRSNLVQQELSLLDKMVQVAPQVMRMLGGLWREKWQEMTPNR